MATYITLTDITDQHLKQFPDEILQPYVDEANIHLEDVAMQKGVLIEQIKTPVSIIIQRCLSNYVVMRFAEDSIGVNNIEITDDDMYVRMMGTFMTIYQDLLKQITVELIMGVSNSSPSARSFSTGKLHRTN